MKDTQEHHKSSKYDSAAYEKASAAFLSMQPNSPGKEPTVTKKEQEQWTSARAHYEQNLTALRTWRYTWWENWFRIAQFILPNSSTALTQSSSGLPTPNSTLRGLPITGAIKNNTATNAVRICGNGLASGLASPSKPWFKVKPLSKNRSLDAAAREWLDEIESRLYTILAGSNFYNSWVQSCTDISAFGTAPCIIYEDEKDIVRFYNPCVGEYYLQSNATLRVDGLYREFVMTIYQIVSFFGIENCPENVRNAWEGKDGNLQKELIIAHAIEPNFDLPHCPKLPGNFSWREVYWIFGNASTQPLSIRGFVDQPFAVPRWVTQSNDAYGRSPGMDAVEDVIQLQVMTVRNAEAIEKKNRPPMLADITLKNFPGSLNPGSVTFVDGLSPGNGMRPLYTVNPDVEDMIKLMESIEQRINRTFLVDAFQILSSNPDKQMTAYEAAQIVQERLQILGPVIENLINDDLKVKLKRTYNIADRKGLMPAPPPSMHGVGIDIEFMSMLSLAQKASSTGGIERIAAFIGNLVPVFPEAKFLFNYQDTVRTMNDLLANPEKILNSEDEFNKLLSQAQQAAQAAAQQEQKARALANIKTGADAASVLAGTDVGSGQSALSQILSGSTGSIH